MTQPYVQFGLFEKQVSTNGSQAVLSGRGTETSSCFLGVSMLDFALYDCQAISSVQGCPCGTVACRTFALWLMAERHISCQLI